MVRRICEPILNSPCFDLLRSYIDYALEVSEPKYSCAVVLRVQVMGIAGFVVGKTESGVLLVLDGNQSDANVQDWSSPPNIIQEFF